MSNLPKYPATDFNQGQQLLLQLGSFWNNIFTDSNKLQSMLRGEGQEYGQNYLNFLECTASVSRLDITVFHTNNWYLMVLSRNACNSVPSIYQPGDLVYGPQPGTVSGRPAGFIQTYGGVDKPGVIEAVLPDSLVDIPFVMQNLVVYPSRVLTNGLDFDICKDRKIIRFHSDPFLDPLFAKKDIFDNNGQKIDEEIAIWVFRGQFDLDFVYTQFGYALGLQMASSQGYKDLLNAFWDMHVLGMSVQGTQQFLSAISGAQTIIDANETLEVVRTEETSKLVVTSSRVYRFPLSANLLVDVGDIGTVYHAGDALSDAVQIHELSGTNPDYSLLPAISLSPAFLSGGYFSELTFKNHDVAVEYLGLDSDNKAVVRFETSGFPGDVERFWDFVQAKGKLPGNKTLAEMLDTRVNKVGEPGPLALPTTINPLEFVIGNIMRNNLFIIKIRQASFESLAPGVAAFHLLREVIPPHTTYIVFIELTPTEEDIDLSKPGDENEAGASESLGQFTIKDPLTDVAYEKNSSPGGAVLTYGDVQVTFKAVSLTCGAANQDACQ